MTKVFENCRAATFRNVWSTACRDGFKTFPNITELALFAERNHAHKQLTSFPVN